MTRPYMEVIGQDQEVIIVPAGAVTLVRAAQKWVTEVEAGGDQDHSSEVRVRTLAWDRVDMGGRVCLEMVDLVEDRKQVMDQEKKLAEDRITDQMGIDRQDQQAGRGSALVLAVVRVTQKWLTESEAAEWLPL